MVLTLRMKAERHIPDHDKVIQILWLAKISRTHKQVIAVKIKPEIWNYTDKQKDKSDKAKHINWTQNNKRKRIEGVVCHIYDLIIHDHMQEIHNSWVWEVLKQFQNTGATLNDKCEFAKQRVKFLRHIISNKAIEATFTPQNNRAIQEFPWLTTITEFQQFNETLNQVAKLIPDL